MDAPSRRLSDIAGANIEAMIAAENDPGKRTLLLILAAINTNLVSNTATTLATSTTLDSHIVSFGKHTKEEEAFLNRIKGAWRVLAGVLAIVQMLMGFALVTLMNKINNIDSAIVALQIADVRLGNNLRAKETPTIPEK
jgi:hypothetical protein